MNNKYYFLTRLAFLGFFVGIILFLFTLFGFNIVQEVSDVNMSNNSINQVFFNIVGIFTLGGFIIGLIIDFLLKAIFGIEGYEKIIGIFKEIGFLIKILISGGIGAGLGYGIASFLHWGTIGGIILGILGFLIGAISSFVKTDIY